MRKDIGPTELGQAEEVLNLLTDKVAAAEGSLEIVTLRQHLGLTRFARGRIHQNVEDVSTRTWVRAWDGGGFGWAATDDLSPQGLTATIARARDLAEAATAPPLEMATAAEYPDVSAYFPSTASTDAARRAAIIAELLDRNGPVDVTGNLRTAVQDMAVVNTAGLSAAVPMTYVALNTVARSDTGSTGYGARIGRDVDSLDFGAAVDEAVSTASTGRNRVPIAEGNYRVILDPPALSMLLLSLGYVGLNSFGAGAASEGKSFVTLNAGERVAAAGFTLIDDPLDPRGLAMPFDAEGSPRQPLTIIGKGTATGVAYDRATAAHAGRTTTGHALPVGGKGPAPHSLAVEPGEKPRSSLFKDLDRGLLIKRIHPFVSLRGGKEAELSGTSRDGVFLVEGGEIVGAAHNVRWSNRMTDVFRSVEGMSAERSVEFMDLPELFPHTTHVPSLLCGAFTVHGSQPGE